MIQITDNDNLTCLWIHIIDRKGMSFIITIILSLLLNYCFRMSNFGFSPHQSCSSTIAPASSSHLLALIFCAWNNVRGLWRCISVCCAYFMPMFFMSFTFEFSSHFIPRKMFHLLRLSRFLPLSSVLYHFDTQNVPGASHGTMLKLQILTLPPQTYWIRSFTWMRSQGIQMYTKVFGEALEKAPKRY